LVRPRAARPAEPPRRSDAVVAAVDRVPDAARSTAGRGSRGVGITARVLGRSRFTALVDGRPLPVVRRGDARRPVVSRRIRVGLSLDG
jgi:hypothetical protein